MAQPQIDVEALVGEIRAEAERLRGTLPEVDRVRGSDEEAERPSATRVPAAAAVTSRLAPLLDPRAVALRSHRGRVGFLVVAAKRLLLRLLTPALEQQAAFNKEVHDTLVDMAAAVAALERRLAATEAARGGTPGSGETDRRPTEASAGSPPARPTTAASRE